MKFYIMIIINSIFLSSLFSNFGYSREGNQISIVGSSTVFPFSTIVAERFAKNTSFKAPVVESTGSGGGFKLFCSGIGLQYPDIVNSSRAIKDSEKEKCASDGITPLEYLIGYDGITFSNSKKSSNFSLTKEQIFNAVSAKIMSNGKMVDNIYEVWSDIDSNLPNIKIDVLAPPPSSGTRDAFVELVLHSVCKKVYKMTKKDYKAQCSSLREDGYVVETGENDNLIIEKLDNDENRFGIFGFSFLDQNKDRVQGSIIDGVDPSFENIAEGSYKVSRPLFFYIKKQHIGVVPGIQEYADYFISLSDEDGPLASIGLIPVE